MLIYEDEDIFLEVEDSQIPWLKLFTKVEYKELTDLPKPLKIKLWDIYGAIESEMRSYYKPHKINMASFGNMLPRVHIHIMARFENDNYFPNPMWGEKLREVELKLPDSSVFYKKVAKAIEKL